MENKRKEFTAGMESKIQEMGTALVAVQDKFDELEDVKAKGAEALAGLQSKKAQLKEEMQLATDLGEAKLLMQQIEELEKDIELQSAINNGQAVKITGEMAELFNTLFTVHASAKTVFTALDKEYVETMSIRSVDEDTATMEGFASKLNFAFSTATALLYDAGLAKQGDVRYGSTHLGQIGAMSKGGALKREMAQVKRELGI